MVTAPDPESGSALPQRFFGERILIVPRAQARAFLHDWRSPGIVVTDAGYFPRAASHLRARTRPIDELVVIACVAGRGWYATDGGRASISPGQILLVPPGETHAYGADENEPWTIWWAHLAGASLTEFLAGHAIPPGPHDRTPTAFFEVATQLKRIVDILERDMTVGGLTRAAGAGWHMLTEIVADRPVAPGMQDVLDAAATAIREDLHADVSADRFATGARVSTSHFSTQFRRRFGMSVKEYQLHARMTRAREIFETRDTSVGATARAVGYADPLYFSRLFVRLHGIPPSAYQSGERGPAVAG